jgi:Domain of unknown function (DUF4158)
MPGEPVDDELAQFWTLSGDDLRVLGARRGALRLGFALQLKHFERFGRYGRRTDFAADVIGQVAAQVEVEASLFTEFDWAPRTMGRHRHEIREYLGFRQVSVEDEDRLVEWLATTTTTLVGRTDVVARELVARFREERIELPTLGRLHRLVRSAIRAAEQRWALAITGRLDEPTINRLRALIDKVDDDDVRGQDLGLVKSAPGNVSLESMMVEIDKLQKLRSFVLPSGLFADVAPKVVAGWHRGR